MLKKNAYLLLLMAAFSSNAFAQTAAAVDNSPLMSAQLAYQQALKEQGKSSGKIEDLAGKLEQARARLAGAQADVDKYTIQLNEATTAQNNASQALQAASKQLDAAWAASRGQ